MKLYNRNNFDLKTIIDGNEVILPAGKKVEVCDGFVDRILKIYPFLEKEVKKSPKLAGVGKVVRKLIGKVAKVAKPKTKK